VKMKEFGVTTFQAEDEIAAICAAIGASYAGSLGVTSSSGPGIALKGEAMGLAVMTELPLVIVNSQRGGPSTGLPTKTEQSDLYQAVYGRNGDAPMPVIAARSPGDAFDCAIEACRIAVQYMTPVMLLTDGYIANAAEPWKVPDPASFDAVPGRPSLRRRTAPTAPAALQARRKGRAPVDQAGHAGPDAPHRRHREGDRHRQPRLFARHAPGA
jgi:2-oxoglutarate ferredoxin oxidoreductase subunit alpha